jgi:hypothetical protein
MSNVRRDTEGRKGKQMLHTAGAGLRGGPAEQLPGAPTCNGRYVTGIIGSMGLVNLGYHTRKKCSDKYPQFGHVPSKIFASPTVGRKSLNNTDFKGSRIIKLPGTHICLGPALHTTHCFLITTNTTPLPRFTYHGFLILAHFIWCTHLCFVHCSVLSIHIIFILTLADT